MNVQVRAYQAQCCPEQAEQGHRVQCVPQCLPDPPFLPGAVIDRQNRLRSLSHAVSTALHKGAHIHDRAVHSQRVGTQIPHDLTIEQHGQDPHGNINEKGGETGCG